MEIKLKLNQSRNVKNVSSSSRDLLIIKIKLIIIWTISAEGNITNPPMRI